MEGRSLLIVTAALLSVAQCQNELLSNPGFESSLSGNWICNNCRGSLVADPKSGKSSFRTAARNEAWQGPRLDITKKVIEGRRYLVNGYVKVLKSRNRQPPQQISVTISYKKSDNAYSYIQVANAQNVRPEDGWVKVTSRFQTPILAKGSYKEIAIYIEGPEAGIDFQVDDFSLKEISDAYEIFFNPDFELPLGSPNNWFCHGDCRGALVNDPYAGKTAYLASSRTASWQSPSQYLPLDKVLAGRSYILSGYIKVKQTNQNQKLQTFSATIRYKKADGKYAYDGVAAISNVLPSDGWVRIVSDFSIKSYGQTEMLFYMDGPESGIEYLFDSFSLKALSQSPAWKRAAKKRIDSSLRKGTLNVAITSSTSRQVTIKIEQLKHEFAFGSAIRAETLMTNEKYRKWYMDNFEWAVFENSMKWRATEPKEGAYQWTTADTALDLLKANNKTVRGHAVIWADKKFNPDWVQNITDPQTLYDAAMKRVTSCLNHFKGRLEHWDVNNEMVNHQFFLDEYNNNPKIRYDIFNMSKKVDPSAMLFLNDYNVVSSGSKTSAYVAQAEEFRAAGVPVDGLGVQSHLSGRPYGSELLSRLDRLSVPNLPIWVTELDYVNNNTQTRAEVLEEALLIYFSHPNVYGILFWGFWDSTHWKGSDAALVNGPELTENAAGLMWKRLFHKDWRSSITLAQSLAAGVTSKVTKKVFYGSYKITVTAANGYKLGSRVVNLHKATGSTNVLFDI